MCNLIRLWREQSAVILPAASRLQLTNDDIMVAVTAPAEPGSATPSERHSTLLDLPGRLQDMKTLDTYTVICWASATERMPRWAYRLWSSFSRPKDTAPPKWFWTFFLQKIVVRTVDCIVYTRRMIRCLIGAFEIHVFELVIKVWTCFFLVTTYLGYNVLIFPVPRSTLQRSFTVLLLIFVQLSSFLPQDFLVLSNHWKVKLCVCEVKTFYLVMQIQFVNWLLIYVFMYRKPSYNISKMTVISQSLWVYVINAWLFLFAWLVWLQKSISLLELFLFFICSQNWCMLLVMHVCVLLLCCIGYSNLYLPPSTENF